MSNSSAPTTMTTVVAVSQVSTGDRLHQQQQQPPQQPPKMPGCVWTNEAVTLLLSLYLREQQLARPQKLKKKDVWRGICAELWRRGLACSWQECDKKYRNLKQTFVRNLKQAGKKECRWMFFPLMLEINRHEPFVGDVLDGGGGGGGLASLQQMQQTDDGDEDEARADADAADAVTYTPAPSPTVMNLSQRSQRSPSPLPLDFGSPPTPKRRRANGFINDTAVIKVESSPPPPQTATGLLPSHPHHHSVLTALPDGLAIKRSASPQLHAQLTAHQVKTSSFDRPLVPLDIRLLQAAMPFVTHPFVPSSQQQQHRHPDSPDQQLQQLQQQALAVPTSPSTMISTECDDEDDDDGGAEDDETAKGNGDEEETRSMPGLDGGGVDAAQQPPKWFEMFMSEFRRHEHRKLQQIAELCAEVRRTNDIEQQRNHILSEKNEILRHMNSYMLNK